MNTEEDGVVWLGNVAIVNFRHLALEWKQECWLHMVVKGVRVQPESHITAMRVL
jgi:hypothetical protein